METLEQSEKVPIWIRPNLEGEKVEIKRVTESFLKLDPNDQNIDQVMQAIQSASVIELSDEEWEHLDNTDSFRNVRPDHVEDAEKITEKYNQDLDADNKRDFKALLDAFTSGKEMEAPVIIKNEKGEMHLLSGNTRLMIARALRVKPNVIIAAI